MSKYKVGDKFVVEIGDIYETTSNLPFEDELYKISGFNSLVFNDFGLDKLDKLDSDYITDNFTELQDDLYDSGYVDGMLKTWGIAKELFEYSSELYEIFGFNEMNQYMSINYVLNNFTPQQAKTKIEEWEKSKEEIKVGDVVTDTSNNRNYIVTGIKQDNNSTWYALLSEIGLTINTKACTLKKTGRHIDIQSVLEQIGGKE